MKQIFIDWLKNRWIVITIVFAVISIAAVVILLLSQHREGTYTNAWFVISSLKFLTA